MKVAFNAVSRLKGIIAIVDIETNGQTNLTPLRVDTLRHNFVQKKVDTKWLI